MTGARICLGAFAGAHGVNGAAKIKTFTESEDGVAAYGAVETEDGRRRFTLKFLRTLKPGLALVSAPEIASREDAAALAGVRIYVGRNRLPETGEDEFYLEDLVGLQAVDETGAARGKITAVHDFGAGDILEIKRAGGPAVMVPFRREIVPEVDITGGKVTILGAALAGGEAAEPGESDS